MLCGEAEQGLPGTVGWGLWAHKGLVDGDRWGRAMPGRGREAPERAASSHGITAAMSWLGNKQRRTHEEQKLDSLCSRSSQRLGPRGRTGDDNVASGATLIWGHCQRSARDESLIPLISEEKQQFVLRRGTVPAEIQVSRKTKRKTMASAVPVSEDGPGSPLGPPRLPVLGACCPTPPQSFPSAASCFYQDSRLGTDQKAEFSRWPLLPTPDLATVPWEPPNTRDPLRQRQPRAVTRFHYGEEVLVPQETHSHIWRHPGWSRLRGCMLLASRGWRPRMLLDILYWVGGPHSKK